MPQTVKIAGKQLPKTYLYVGGAAVVGIVGYAWWTGGGGGTAEPEVLPATDEFGDERITPNTVDTFDVAVDNRTGVKTNGEWKQAADAYLSGIGYDSTVVSTALGRYLARQRLNKVDIEIARQAVASFGEPPEGRPWYLLEEESTGAAVGLVAPTNLRVTSKTPTSVAITWNPVAGASGYEVKRDGGGVARHASPGHTSTGLHPGGPYVFRVTALNTANQRSPEAVLSVTLTAADAGAGIAAPRPTVTSSTRTAQTVKWPPVPGATHYFLSRVGGGNVRVNGRSHTSRGLKPNTSYTYRVRAAKGTAVGPVGTVTAKTRS
jgi:hypothetical protein